MLHCVDQSRSTQDTQVVQVAPTLSSSGAPTLETLLRRASTSGLQLSRTVYSPLEDGMLRHAAERGAAEGAVS